MSKPWQTRPPRGAAVELPEVLALAAGSDPGTTPRIVRRAGRTLAHYSRTRMYLDRDAWEALTSEDDVLVLRIRPKGDVPFTVALTRRELERVFGSVRETASWDRVRCYHFPMLPPAVEAFRVSL
jgi:hypothetical protein